MFKKWLYTGFHCSSRCCLGLNGSYLGCSIGGKMDFGGTCSLNLFYFEIGLYKNDVNELICSHVLLAWCCVR